MGSMGTHCDPLWHGKMVGHHVRWFQANREDRKLIPCLLSQKKNPCGQSSVFWVGLIWVLENSLLSPNTWWKWSQKPNSLIQRCRPHIFPKKLLEVDMLSKAMWVHTCGSCPAVFLSFVLGSTMSILWFGFFFFICREFSCQKLFFLQIVVHQSLCSFHRLRGKWRLDPSPYRSHGG